MNATLTVVSEDIGKEELQRLTEDLCHSLNRDGGISATLATQAGKQGTKTVDPIVIGQIAVALVGGGGAIVALINVLNTFLSRSNYLEIEISNKKGETIKIKGDHLKPDQLNRTIRFITKHIETSK